MKKYLWADYYIELADIILKYKDKRQEFCEIIKDIYKTLKIELPKLSKSGELVDIDPFSFYAFFNKQISKENRIKIITEIKKRFSIKAEVPTYFSGIPVANNQNITFYPFDERMTEIIGELWNFFEQVIIYTKNKNSQNRKNFIDKFNLVQTYPGVKWKLTMALFWIRPYDFINLDSRNRWYLAIADDISDRFNYIDNLKEVPNGEEYLNICDEIKKEIKKDKSYSSIIQFSEKAYEISEKVNNQVHYWIYSPGENSKYWDKYYEEGIMGIGWSKLGNLKKYKTKSKVRAKLQQEYDSQSKMTNDTSTVWKFVKEMKKGDIIFVKKGRDIILGYGVVTSNYYYDENREFPNLRNVDWKEKGEWEHPGKAVIKTLTDITSYRDYVNELKDIFNKKIEPVNIIEDKYTKENFLDEVFIEEGEYDLLTEILEHKKNIILQGPPGTGKTFVAKRLAYSILESKDDDKIEMIQFHQSYSYEDFIMGYRPNENGFEIHTGAFYDFCKKAEEDKENKYFFIIDEINRGNLSKIFGELFMLIENEKRGDSIRLLYRDELFSVPENLYIIGMMNTADRSLAFLDYALRRRFAFIDFHPAFESDGFKKYLKEKKSTKLNKLINCIKELNLEIKEDSGLGEDFQIGHSYFITDKEITISFLKRVVFYELEPLLKEYYYDDNETLESLVNCMKEAIK